MRGPWLQRSFSACDACGSLLRFIGSGSGGRHYSSRQPFWSFLQGKRENRTAERLNMCLEWLAFSLSMPLALGESTYMHLRMFLLGTIGWRTAELSIHWGLSFISASCSGNGVRLPESLSPWQVMPLYRNVGIPVPSLKVLKVLGPAALMLDTFLQALQDLLLSDCSAVWRLLLHAVIEEEAGSKTCISSAGILIDGMVAFCIWH